MNRFNDTRLDRRRLLAASVGALSLPVPLLRAVQPARAATEASGRILVVLEISGGNDGLNTLVPYGDDAYYRARPNIGVRPDKLRKLDEHFGLRGGMAGFERLFKDGNMAIVHGCGYAQPSFSHFTSMAYWHTAAPNSGSQVGWIGALADAMAPGGEPNFLVNIDTNQSLAVRSRQHVPVVFDDPEDFGRQRTAAERGTIGPVPAVSKASSPARRYLAELARSARDASVLVRDAWGRYSSPVDYGLAPLGFPRIVSLIDAGLPTRLFYTAYRNNVFDTHVHQGGVHSRLLTYASDAVAAFFADLERIGRADDVVVLAFSEFGRRVAENSNLGTDHGTANVMFVAGKGVQGGYYGEPPSLTELDETDNLVHTTDFRRVYASVAQGWLGVTDTRELLRGKFEPFPMFG